MTDKTGNHKIRPPKLAILTARFYDRIMVDVNSGCWLWTGALGKLGYGNLEYERKCYAAHRLSYEIHHGPIPDGMYVLHSCDMRYCVNPDHLRAGTQLQNVQDTTKRKRNHRAGKITADEAREILSLKSNATYLGFRDYVADKYQVSATTIGDIWYGRSWLHLSGLPLRKNVKANKGNVIVMPQKRRVILPGEMGP